MWSSKKRAHDPLACGHIEATRCTVHRLRSHHVDTIDEDRWRRKASLSVDDCDARHLQIAEAVMQKLSRLFDMRTVGHVKQLNHHRRVISGLHRIHGVVSYGPEATSEQLVRGTLRPGGKGGIRTPGGT